MNPNQQQLQVINHRDGPCLVAAVPGSGKTASLTERVRRMIESGIDPSSILSITFTNKAAKEMRERIASKVGEDAAKKMTISTFHSMCARIIRQNARLVGLTENFSIYDSDDQERLLKVCIEKVEGADGRDFTPNDGYINSLYGYIEGRRNACLTHAEAVVKYELLPSQVKVVQEYFKALRLSNAIDFTGLLSETIRLFEQNPDVLARYQSAWRYINVDEVQDTNIAQYKLIKMLAEKHRNVLCVGDLDQSVYAFRNAAPENILRFEKDFNALVLKLEKNYRSTPEILRFSQNLIEHNKLRKQTKLETDNLSGGMPRVTGKVFDYEMAEFIASDIAARISKGSKPKDVAVLYRVNYASKVLEEALRRRMIKYKVIGGQSFYDRKEVKGSLAILKMMANPDDRVAFQKVVDVCCKGVGEKSISIIIDYAIQNQVTVLDSARKFSTLNSAQARALGFFLDAFFEAKQLPPSESLIRLAQKTSFWSRMESDSTPDNDRCANIQEVADDLYHYFEENPGGTISGYLQAVSLMSSSDEDVDEDGQVRLMTMHASKGLEFPHVYVSHCCNGIIPHARTLSIENPREREFQKEEERRLLYVAMTRAQKTLDMCFFRVKGGRGRQQQVVDPSPFLFETNLFVPGVPLPKGLTNQVTYE